MRIVTGYVLALAAVSLLCPCHLSAAVLGSATISTSQTSAPFTYSLTLQNTGTLPIDTFWFAWLDNPDTSFMSTVPSNIHSASGWFGLTSHLSPADGYGIEYYAFIGGLAPGQTLTGFSFVSNETPDQLRGSVNVPQLGQSFPVTTAFLYSGGAFSPSMAQITTQVVPEPSAMALAAAATATICAWAAWRAQRLTGARF